MTEGQYPKVDGDVHYASEFDDAMKLLANSYGFAASLMGNATGRGSIGSKLMNSAFDADIASTKTNLTHRDFGSVGQYYSKSGAIVFESPSVLLDGDASTVFSHLDYDVFTVWDECDNSSIDAAKWPTSTNCTEDGSGINTNGSATGQLTSADLSSYKVITFRYGLTTNTFSGNITLKFTDGTSNSTIVGLGNNQSADGEITVYLDWSSKKAYVVMNERLDSVSRTNSYYVSLSGWTSFTIDLSWSNAPSTTRMYYVRVGNPAPTTVLTHSVSADGGSNYTSMGVLKASPTTVGTAGASLKSKLTGTVSSGEVVVIHGMNIGPVV